MIELLTKLEPRQEPSGTLIFKTVEEVLEIFFIVKGSIEIGFEANREARYVIRLHNGGVIGIYNVTYDKKTMFHYRVKENFFGYTIRKDNWKSIIFNPEYEDITCHVRK